jgi:Ca2+/H+ antiporter, TMEM165/GDT1 family
MQWRVILSTFGLVFLAELGDKTQLMTISLVSSTKAPLSVLAGSCLALCTVTGIGVMAGELVTRFIPAAYLQKGAALLFIGIGIVMLLKK